MPKNYQIIQLKSVDSTSRYLKDYVAKNCPQQAVFCTTKNQTAGYGQQKRSWLTNEKSAIFSLAYPLPKNYQLTGLVSLHIAALLHQSLVELTGDTLYLKWPNDLFNTNGKVAGVLIEQVIKKDYRAFIIGIGINRNSPELAQQTNNASSMSDFDIQELFKLFLKKVQQSQLQNYDYIQLSQYWQDHDLFAIGEAIQLIKPTHQTSEADPIQKQPLIYLGLDQHGQAKININGKLTFLASGQTSIRKI